MENADDVVFELESHGVLLDELDGPVPSVRISALTGLNCEQLESKIMEVADDLELYEDYKCAA